MQQILTLLLILAEIAQMIGNLQDLPKTPLHKSVTDIFQKHFLRENTKKCLEGFENCSTPGSNQTSIKYVKFRTRKQL